MWCCGGAKEESFGPPANQHTAPPNCPTSGHDREPRGPTNARSGAPKVALSIEIPAISLAELKKLTGYFGQKALIGEGSYGKVFFATLSTGEPATIKKLDPNASLESDS